MPAGDVLYVGQGTHAAAPGVVRSMRMGFQHHGAAATGRTSRAGNVHCGARGGLELGVQETATHYNGAVEHKLRRN